MKCIETRICSLDDGAVGTARRESAWGGGGRKKMILLPIVIGLIGILPAWTPHIEADRAAVAQGTEQLSTVRDITITARRYEFTPARIEVKQGDILRITLVAEDIAHSFTIDEYRISKRAAPGRSVTFEFCADRRGRFVFYCSLTTDERCREMRGELIVE